MPDNKNIFERLERLNAKLDVLIDAGEWEKIDKVFTESVINKKSRKFLKESFKHQHCTYAGDGDKNWKNLLANDNNIPIEELTGFDEDEPEPLLLISKNSGKQDYILCFFSYLFWAKLIRAKIQEKGSDCYISRLDDVMAYLERHLPAAQDTNLGKLYIIYLLELAACGQEPDSRSFGERARRFIILKKKEDNSFIPSYDLLARYNIGVSYFHEQLYELAAREFDYVIWAWKEPDEYCKENSLTKDCYERYFKDHLAKTLLYYPAVFFKAEAYQKLQLTYHSIKTITDFIGKSPEINHESPNLIKAKAFQEIGNLEKSFEKLCSITKPLVQTHNDSSGIEKEIIWFKKLKNSICKNEESFFKNPNSGRIFDLTISHFIERLKEITEDKQDIAKEIFKVLIDALGVYRRIARYCEPDRRGYLEQTSELLGLLVNFSGKNNSGGNNNYDEFARELYFQHRIEKIGYIKKILAILQSSNNKISFCLCENSAAKFQNTCNICSKNSIALDRLPSDHYDEYCKNLHAFLDKSSADFNEQMIYIKSYRKNFCYKKYFKAFHSTKYPRKIWCKYASKKFFDLFLKKERKSFLKILGKRKPLEIFYILEHHRKFWKTVVSRRSRKLFLISKDREAFRNYLVKIEEKRENLLWRKYENKERWKYTHYQEKPQKNHACSSDCMPQRAREQCLGRLMDCGDHKSKFDRIDRNGAIRLFREDYEHVMNEYDERFVDHLNCHSRHYLGRDCLHFLGLRRWNSSSPALGKSVGGGYLLYYTNAQGRIDLGIAIDPGFDFIRNLFQMGYSLLDIDIVLLSHAHVDHIRDFESLLTLSLELKKRRDFPHKIHAIMTLGVYQRLEKLIESPGFRQFVETYIIDITKGTDSKFGDIEKNGKVHIPPIKFKPKCQKRKDRPSWHPEVEQEAESCADKLIITPTIAYHNDHSDCSDSFGFKIKIKYINMKYSFGYTGDTRWHPDVMGQYMGGDDKCDGLIIHLGSLIDVDNKLKKRSFESYTPSGKGCLKLINEKNHPYLPGLLKFMTEIKNSTNNNTLILVGEFGEELRGGIRRDLFYRLRDTFGQKTMDIRWKTSSLLNILPIDVGLDVILEKGVEEEDTQNRDKPGVWCINCQKYVPINQADFETYGLDEALFCVCETCRRTTSLDVLQERLRSLYEEGLPLVPAEVKVQK